MKSRTSRPAPTETDFTDLKFLPDFLTGRFFSALPLTRAFRPNMGLFFFLTGLAIELFHQSVSARGYETGQHQIPGVEFVRSQCKAPSSIL
jgi:hypothetical protein